MSDMLRAPVGAPPCLYDIDLENSERRDSDGPPSYEEVIDSCFLDGFREPPPDYGQLFERSVSRTSEDGSSTWSESGHCFFCVAFGIVIGVVFFVTLGLVITLIVALKNS